MKENGIANTRDWQEKYIDECNRRKKRKAKKNYPCTRVNTNIIASSVGRGIDIPWYMYVI